MQSYKENWMRQLWRVHIAVEPIGKIRWRLICVKVDCYYKNLDCATWDVALKSGEDTTKETIISQQQDFFILQ